MKTGSILLANRVLKPTMLSGYCLQSLALMLIRRLCLVLVNKDGPFTIYDYTDNLRTSPLPCHFS
jgi:hypothetical protein